MNILSQILNYETKNLFIDDIIEKIKAKITNAILSILTNFSKNRYIKSFLNLQKEVNNLIIELRIDFISLIDNSYKKSDVRKKEYYINKSKRQSIYRWIRNCKLPSIIDDSIKTESTLYIMADEK